MEAGWPNRSEVLTLSSRFEAVMARAHCSACNGYYGPAFGQPVCATCHAFLYDTENHHLQVMSEDRLDPDSDSDRDSGNDEPNDNFAANAASRGANQQDTSLSSSPPPPAPPVPPEHSEPSELSEAAAAGTAAPSEGAASSTTNYSTCGGKWRATDRVDNAADDRDGDDDGEAQMMLAASARRHHEVRRLCGHFSRYHSACLREAVDERGPVLNQEVQDLPPEVLMVIFSFLDDVSLYAVANVCRRWYEVLTSQTNSEQWRHLTRRRWPLFHSLVHVPDWFAKYCHLVESSFCLTCIYQMAHIVPDLRMLPPIREKRLFQELRGLIGDSPEGIKAQPLDSSSYNWQASITGPVGSPYEGGIFFLYMKIPFAYPFRPPEVRFLTKIFHPNVSRHGEIGIDSIQRHNWVSGLTVSKVLLSIQSLLTDPFTDVCMEPEIGRVYVQRRKLFDAIARHWTWKFALCDVLPCPSR